MASNYRSDGIDPESVDERAKQKEKQNEEIKALMEEAILKHVARWSKLKSEDEHEKPEKKLLDEEIKALEEVIEKQEARLTQLQSKGFRLANCYFLFQGVILATLCNRNSVLKCSDSWIFATISVLASAVNLFALVSMGAKYNRIFTQQAKTISLCNVMLRQKHMLPNTVYRYSLSSPLGRGELYIDNFEIAKRRVYVGICITFFLLFAIVVFCGCIRFLC
jgi:hypothetical protein